MPKFTLSGTVLFDHNGNGAQDAGEPPIPGASLRVGGLSATSAQDGTYNIQGIPAGNQPVRVSAAEFRYHSLSLAAFQPIDQPVNVAVKGNTRHDLGLMQGFLTLPILQTTALNPDKCYDWDPSPQTSLWWNAESWPART